jgi:hypothetical protein
MSFHLYFNILHNHPHHTYFKMNVNHLYFLFEDEKFKLSDPYIFVKTPPLIFFILFFRDS